MASKGPRRTRERAAWLLLAALLLAAGPPRSRLDGFADAIAEWVTRDERVAIHVAARSPALAEAARLVSELLTARTGAVLAGSESEARVAGCTTFVSVELASDGKDLQAFGKVLVVRKPLWAEVVGERPGLFGTLVVRAPLDDDLRALLGGGAVATPPPRGPRKLAFRALSNGLDLGAPLLDLAAGDLNADGKAELVALTTDEVVVLAVGVDALQPLARAPLEGPAPVPRPRTPVGAVAIDFFGFTARSSEHAAGASFTYADGKLTRVADQAHYPLCVGSPAQRGGPPPLSVNADLTPGLALYSRDSVETPAPVTARLPARFQAMRCTRDLLAVSDDHGALFLVHRDGLPGAGPVGGFGDAVALADLDGDGVPELVASSGRAPGGPDAINIYSVGTAGARLSRRGPSTPDSVIAIAAGDFDGDGQVDVIAASRAAGTRVDLWLAE
jgi:hypothetical protein